MIFKFINMARCSGKTNELKYRYIKPGHSISYMTAFAPSKDSDQPVYLCSLISLCCQPEDALDAWLPGECPVKTDQTAQMGRLIWVFAGCTCSVVGNAVPRLISLRKHAYQIYWKFYHQKNETFQIKNSDIFQDSAQNIDCKYSLEPRF